MGVAHVVTPGSPRPCHQPNRNPLHPDPGDDAGDDDNDDDNDDDSDESDEETLSWSIW